MVTVSVITIAKDKEEIAPLIEKLKTQTYKDFELVISTKKGIPQAWNDAISKAKGSIFVFTESDAMPLNDTWLKEMVDAVKANDSKYGPFNWTHGTIVRGIEIDDKPFCFCNLAGRADIFKNNKLDESFPIAEDTEYFTRLYNDNYFFKELPIAPVIHNRKFKGFSKEISNAYLYGKLHVQIIKKHIEIRPSIPRKNILTREFTKIFSPIAYMLGILRGLI